MSRHQSQAFLSAGPPGGGASSVAPVKMASGSFSTSWVLTCYVLRLGQTIWSHSLECPQTATDPNSLAAVRVPEWAPLG